MSSLGSNIKFLRERHNITPLAMSKKLQISLQDYNAWESGLSLPTITNVMDICAVYGLKNPTDLFSDNFIQIYNAREIKTVKEVAKKKAETQKWKDDSEAKLNYMVKDGSYQGSTSTFTLTIILAIGILIALFLPCFVVGEKVYIGYMAPWAGIVPAIFMYFLAIIAVFMIYTGIKGNYKILAGNEFMPKNTAIALKLAYMFSGLLSAAFAIIAYFTTKDYEYGLTAVTALSLVYMTFALISAKSIKPAPKAAVTYTYVIKFAKYKLRTDTPRKLSVAAGIIGLIVSIVCIALAVVQFVFEPVKLVDQFGLNTGIIATITTAFYKILPFVFGSLFAKVAWVVVALLLIAVNIANLVISGKTKKAGYDGYFKEEQTRSIRKGIAITFAMDMLVHIITYTLIICGLAASVEGTKLLYEYYLLPIMTVTALLAAIRYTLYSKMYDAFRGAETYEVTGFSEVKQDEEKRKQKLDKKSRNSNSKSANVSESAPTDKPAEGGNK